MRATSKTRPEKIKSQKLFVSLSPWLALFPFFPRILFNSDLNRDENDIIFFVVARDDGAWRRRGIEDTSQSDSSDFTSTSSINRRRRCFFLFFSFQAVAQGLARRRVRRDRHRFRDGRPDYSEPARGSGAARGGPREVRKNVYFFIQKKKHAGRRRRPPPPPTKKASSSLEKKKNTTTSSTPTTKKLHFHNQKQQ